MVIMRTRGFQCRECGNMPRLAMQSQASRVKHAQLVRQIKLRIQALINILIFTDRCSFPKAAQRLVHKLCTTFALHISLI